MTHNVWGFIAKIHSDPYIACVRYSPTCSVQVITSRRRCCKVTEPKASLGRQFFNSPTHQRKPTAGSSPMPNNDFTSGCHLLNSLARPTHQRNATAGSSSIPNKDFTSGRHVSQFTGKNNSSAKSYSRLFANAQQGFTSRRHFLNLLVTARHIRCRLRTTLSQFTSKNWSAKNHSRLFAGIYKRR